MPEHASHVMVVSQSNKAYEFMTKILPSNQFSPIHSAHTAGEAERIMINKPADLVVINAPLKDEFGTEMAITLTETYHAGVMIMVKTELYEEVSYQVQEYGILTIPRPCSSFQIIQTMQLLAATQNRLQAMKAENETLEQKMQSIQLVSRAKVLLMDHENMTEAEAHRYLEKMAMDRCIKKVQMAQEIIEQYQ